MKEESYFKGIAVFIDLLGTKSNENNFKESLKINRIFKRKTEILNDPNIFDTNFEKKVVTFSDCAYLLYREKDANIGKLGYTVLHDIAELSMKFLNKGVIFRGGISTGNLYFDSENIFFGPAVNEAYMIESQISIYPRICISEELTNDINKFTKELERKRINVNKILKKDIDNKYYLNIFASTEDGLKLSFENKCGEILEKIKSNIDLKISEYRENKKIYEKYKWLSKYISEVNVGKEKKNTIIQNGHRIEFFDDNKLMDDYEQLTKLINEKFLKKEWEECVKACNEQLHRFGDKSQFIYYTRGKAYFYLGEIDLAIKDFEKEETRVIENDDKEEVYSSLVTFYLMLGKDDKEYEYNKKIVDLNSKSLEYYRALYLISEDRSKGQKIAIEIIKENSDYDNFHEILKDYNIKIMCGIV